MREIKFRWMDVQWNWHIWLLCIYEWITYISNSKWVPRAYIIRPETVWQFTDLQDKNWKDIYEGDIIKWSWNTKWVIYFCKNHLQFRFNIIWEPWDRSIDYYWLDKIEIIWNIYEDKELLKN